MRAVFRRARASRAAGGRRCRERRASTSAAGARNRVAVRGAAPPQPLAARMRPRTLDEFVGQEHLLAPGQAAARGDRAGHRDVDGVLGSAGHRQDDARAADRAATPIASSCRSRAVTEGVPRVREIVARGGGPARRWGAERSCSPTRSTASTRRSRTRSCRTSKRERSRSIGATTENPIVRDQRRAAVARARVRAAAALRRRHRGAHRRALGDAERGLGALAVSTVDDDALELLATRGRRRRAARADGARGGGGSRRRRRTHHASRSRATRCSCASRTTTRAARRRTTCSARSTSRCAAAIRRARCTGWRA